MIPWQEASIALCGPAAWEQGSGARISSLYRKGIRYIMHFILGCDLPLCLLDICYSCLLALCTRALVVSWDTCSVCLIHLWMLTEKFFSWSVLTVRCYRCFARAWQGCGALQASCWLGCWLAAYQLPFWLSLAVSGEGAVGGSCRVGSAAGWMLCLGKVFLPVASWCFGIICLSTWPHKAHTHPLTHGLHCCFRE